MLEVCSARCAECLFSPQEIVSDARRQDLLDQCRRRDRYFICHQSPPGRPLACRGWFETFACTLSQVASRLGLVAFVPAHADMPAEADPDAALAQHQCLPHQGTLAHGMRHARARRSHGRCP